MEENKQLDLRVRIYTLLVEGHTIPKVASLIGCSDTYVRKTASFYVNNGELSPRGRYNRFFEQTKPNPTTPLPPPSNPTTPMLPASIGAVFSIIKKPKGLQYNLNRLAYSEEKHYYKAQWGPHKCQIWLHGGFRGASPNEILGNARETLLAIAGTLERKHDAQLSLIKWLGVEWIDFDERRSARIARGAKLEKGARVEVAGAIHKFSDYSHPDKFQINKKPQGDQRIPTQQAEIHHYLYSGLLAQDLYAIKEVLMEVQNVVQSIKIRMDLEAKK